MLSPATYISILYAAGIILGRFFNVPITAWMFSAIVLAAASAVLIARRQKPLYLIALSILLIGVISFQLAVSRPTAIKDQGLSKNPLVSISMSVKDRLLSVIKSTMDEPYASLMGSIIFGATASPLPSDIQENYRTAGVIHLLVVSGTQVSIIVSVISNICKYLFLAKKMQLFVVTIANIMFTIMTGAGASITRAAIMAEAALLSRAFGRSNDFYNSLSMSALILMCMDPLVLFDIGFQLSFVATWALFYVAPAFEEKIKGFVPDSLANLISISIAPTIATTPIILYNFAQVSIVSFITNFLILPWIEVTVILGFASTVIGLIFLPLAYVINNTLTLLLAVLNGIINYFSAVPFACLYAAPPIFPIILLYYIMLAMLVEKIRGKINIRLNKYLMVAVLLIAALLQISASAAGDLTVTFMDVGQGDAILVQSPSGKNMLIDGGSAGKNDYIAKRYLLPVIRKKGISRLDCLVLTHPHEDHVGGLPYLLKNIKVDLIVDSGQPSTSPAYQKFLSYIGTGKIPYKLGRAGQSIDLGGGAVAYILHPAEPLGDEMNDNSIVIKLVYGKTSFLLMGDLAFEGEKKLIMGEIVLKSDLIKIAHHGSKYSTSDDFISRVRPAYAVISVGARNKFKHPSPATLKKLSDVGIRIYRTDINGTIVAKSDGEKMDISLPRNSKL